MSQHVINFSFKAEVSEEERDKALKTILQWKGVTSADILNPESKHQMLRRLGFVAVLIEDYLDTVKSRLEDLGIFESVSFPAQRFLHPRKHTTNGSSIPAKVQAKCNDKLREALLNTPARQKLNIIAMVKLAKDKPEKPDVKEFASRTEWRAACIKLQEDFIAEQTANIRTELSHLPVAFTLFSVTPLVLITGTKTAIMKVMRLDDIEHASLDEPVKLL